jgi:hypothetical protein
MAVPTRLIIILSRQSSVISYVLRVPFDRDLVAERDGAPHGAGADGDPRDTHGAVTLGRECSPTVRAM